MKSIAAEITNSRPVASEPESRRNPVASDSAPVPVPPLPRNESGADVADPLATIDAISEADAFMMEALASGDPSVLLAGMASRLRTTTINSAESSLRSNQITERAHTAAQMEAYRQASEAQQTASNWQTVAKVGAYVAAGLAIAVGVVGALHTGSASLIGGIALACVIVSSVATIGVMAAMDAGVLQPGPQQRALMIAIAVVALLGAVCSLGASSGTAVATVGALVSITAQSTSIVADIGTECHWWNEPPAEFRLVLAGLSLAGSLTTAASGIGGASRATESVSIVGKTISASAEITRGAALVAQGVGTAGAAVMNYQSDQARIDGDRHKNERAALRTQDEDLIEGIRYAMKSFRRVINIASDTQQETNATRTRMTGNFARA